MSVQRQTRRPVSDGFPETFGERLEEFMQVSGLGPRPLGRLLRVSPYRVREWRRGVVPSWHNLSRLLTLAESMGLRDILMPQDVPVGWDVVNCSGDSRFRPRQG